MIEFGSVVESSVIGRTEMGIALLLLSVRREDSVMFSLLINHNSHIQKEKKISVEFECFTWDNMNFALEVGIHLLVLDTWD
jgi:hypothetical protein